MILTDREIRIAVDQGLIKIDPAPSADAYSSTSVDLILHNAARSFRESVDPPVVVDPGSRDFSYLSISQLLTEQVDLSPRWPLKPRKLLLAWTAELVVFSGQRAHEIAAMPAARLIATYHIRSDAGSIAARAQAIAVEQSVEMPVSAIDDPAVLSDIVGAVEAIEDRGGGVFAVRIGLATATTGHEAGQLMNMLFGNTSIHDDVTLEDVEIPPDLAASFGGPRHGLAGLRSRVGAERRALTCSALKPQGLPPSGLADIAYRLALGGLDFIKDDHGLADQAYSPFAERARACAAAVARANRSTGGRTRYVPSVSNDLDQLRRQIAVARDAGLDMVLVTPMIIGLPSLAALVRSCPDMAFMAHPALAGASRIAPPLLLGKLFRLLGVDATVFPNHGGRFGYSPATCSALAAASRAPWHDLRACVPVPAGGMTTERVPEMLDFYGSDVMLLIGGGLLAARERLTEETAAFTQSVARAGAVAKVRG